MSFLKIILALVVTLLNPLSTMGEGQDPITPKKIEVVLGIDHVEKLDFTASSKIQIGNPGILTHLFIPQKKEITLIGMKPGTSSVTIRNMVGDIKAIFNVKVSTNSQSKLVQQLKLFLGDIEGLEIGIKGDSVYVGGKIVVPDDIGKVMTVLSDSKYKKVIRLVELSPHTQRIIARRMQDEIQNNGMRNVTVRVVNHLFWLDGVVESQAQKDKSYEIAGAYLPDMIQSLARKMDSVEKVEKNIIQNFINVNADSKPKPPPPKMLKITAQFVELTKDYNKIFGFSWTPLLGGSGGKVEFGKTTSGGVTTKSDGTLSGTISNLFPRLNSAKSAGHARVIQSGILLLKDKEAGTLTKTLTQPYAIGTGDTMKAGTAKAGFSLNVTPKILENEQIDLTMNISVSASSGYPPETQENSIKTSIVVKSKESAVLGGVVVKKNSTGFDKPSSEAQNKEVEDGAPLFSFLRSKTYLSSKSQFVVFITPEIVESASSGTQNIKRKFRRRKR